MQIEKKQPNARLRAEPIKTSSFPVQQKLARSKGLTNEFYTVRLLAKGTLKKENCFIK